MDIAGQIRGAFTKLSAQGLAGKVVWTSVTAGAYDLVTSTQKTVETVRIVDASISALKRELRQGVTVAEGDLLVSIPAYGLVGVPKAGDKLTVNGEAHVVVVVNIISPAGKPFLYELQARRG